MITKEQFAIWSLERDLNETDEFDELPWETAEEIWENCPNEHKIYIEEAEYYFTQTLDKWPLDILERLKMGQ